MRDGAANTLEIGVGVRNGDVSVGGLKMISR